MTLIPGIPNIQTDTPTVLAAPDGMQLLVFRTYDGYETLVEGEEVDTTAIDFGTFTFVDEATVEGAVSAILPLVENAGHELLAYGLFGGIMQDITLPEQACLLGVCIDLPFGGATVATVNVYRLWIMTRARGAASGSYRPAARGSWLWLIGQVMLAIVSYLAIVALMNVANGKMPWGAAVSPPKPAGGGSFPPPWLCSFWPCNPTGATPPVRNLPTPPIPPPKVPVAPPVPVYIYAIGAGVLGLFGYVAYQSSKGGA